jgi:NTP pyrophosphatase (non-canonical NTP hydrolase)
MQISEYQKKVLRTDVEDYSGFQKRLKENKTTVHTAIYGFMISSGALDLMKKKIAYDAQPDKLFKVDAQNSATLLNFQNPIFLDKIAESSELSQQFHYVIGAITELNELMVALAKGAITGTLDKVNVGEEIGDVQFYLNAATERLELDMEDILDKNVSKLESRYPEKFSSENATNRDLGKEREILEGNQGVTNV